MTTIPETPDNTATNGTPLGWGFHDCIARAIFQSAGSGPREAADAVLAELAKRGYTIASTTGTPGQSHPPVYLDPDVVTAKLAAYGGQETWDPDGTGDTHYGVEVGGHPLPPMEDPATERYLIDRAEHDAHTGDIPEDDDDRG